MIAPQRHHGRRGAALLIVLAALVLTVTAVSSLAMQAATVSLARKQDRAIQNADELALAAESVIEHWLHGDASTVVLPPDVITPEVQILHQAWELNDLMTELRITAWDQDGMMPLHDPPWPSALPEPIRGFLSTTDQGRFRVSSLEMISEVSDVEPWSIYPLPDDTAPERIGVESTSSLTTESMLRLPTRTSEGQLAFGAVLAGGTHRPARSERNRQLRLNVNTAPLPLLEAAMRDVGRGGLDAIRAARLEGRHTTYGASGNGDLSRAGIPGAGVQFVSVSGSWAFRIDVVVDHVIRSWWLVIVRDDNRWRVVDRHVIAE